MPTPLPGAIPVAVDSVEKLLVYAAQLYRLTASGRFYSERSDSDRRPFMQVSIDDVFGTENSSKHFMIFRGAVPLNPNYAIEGKTLWEDANGLEGQITLPTGFTD